MYKLSVSVNFERFWENPSVFLEELRKAKVDRNYKELYCVNCKGRMEGNQVKLSDIPSYGIVAFEAKL